MVRPLPCDNANVRADQIVTEPHSRAAGAWDVPSSVFTVIETLLPTGKGKFLELWAAPAKLRPGWVHMSQQQPVSSSRELNPNTEPLSRTEHLECI